MTLLDRLLTRTADDLTLSWQEYQQAATAAFRVDFGGLQGREERTAEDFATRVASAFHGSGPVFALITARALLFSEARFAWQQIDTGRPGAFTGGGGLGPLERPWPGGTTADLLARMEQHASLAGNAYVALRPGGRLRVLRPDWVTVVVGNPDDADAGASDLDAEVLAYLYQPRGGRLTADAEVLLPEEVVHYAPIPDPVRAYVGMSWITPVIHELAADRAMQEYQRAIYRRAAVPALLVKVEQQLSEPARRRLREALQAVYGGVSNAGKTLILGSGADVKPLGLDMEKLAFVASRAAGENRLATAAGVPSIVVGFQQGLDAATYSNYKQALRRFSDLTIRPLWRNLCGSMERVFPAPAGQRLWFDDRDIPALAEDLNVQADVLVKRASAVGILVRSGYTPESAVAAVEGGNLNVLEHTGLIPVTVAPEELPATGGSNSGGNQ